jgi:type I restriction enzyme R subunit
MPTSNFAFLEREFPILYNIGVTAELNLQSDAGTALWKLRLLTEKVVGYVFEEHQLTKPREDTLHNRIRALEDERIVQNNIAGLMHGIKHKGNAAVHDGKGSYEDAKTILESTFKVACWFYQTYSASLKNMPGAFFVPANPDVKKALIEAESKFADLEKKFNALLVEKESVTVTEKQKEEISVRSEAAASKVLYSEAETRGLIDEQLHVAGWDVDTNRLNFKLHGTKPQKGKNMAIAEWKVGDKWADYALFIGTELYGLVEAKKWGLDISTNLHQSKVYAELAASENGAALIGEWTKYKVPFLFSTNGREYLEQIKTKSGIWFLDVRKKENNARALQAWYSPKGLQELYQRDVAEANNNLAAAPPDFLRNPSGLALREFQIKAIQEVEKAVAEKDRRRALLAMATGTGKTRTIMGLCYRLIKANRFKRILFLVDRTALGIQAINMFKDNKVEDLNTFSEIYQVDELKKALPDLDTRLHFATVQSLVKRIFYNDADRPGEKPTIDTYDCIIIDEAHRGYLMDRELDDEELDFKNQQDYVSKYRMVLDYFDAFAIGLTATPALHTIEIFGRPVFNYSYREAVIDGFLVDHEPPHIIRTKLSEEGIVWEKGQKPKAYDKESGKIIELDELEDELKIEVEQFNKLVHTENFNRTVVKHMAKHLDPEGDEKTLVFAASDVHADLLVQLFKEEFAAIGIEPGDGAIEKITGKSYEPLELIKRYKNEKFPNIAVTVDLLTTGIDIPTICNLLFVRRVKSRILYEQMMGRATRLCPEIRKEVFRIFDAVRIYEALEEFTNMKPVVPNPTSTFGGLAEEITKIKGEERLKQQVEQIIAKLQRKKKQLSADANEKFKFASGSEISDYIAMLKELPSSAAAKKILESNLLWKILDEFKATPAFQLVSEHEDEALEPTYGYGKSQKPADYIEGFRKYIQENVNRMTALKLVCNKPTELDRKSLKELHMVLDTAGYTDVNLRHAWKHAKNQDIAADIISFIRTLSLGSNLVDHETRIRKAMNNIRGMREWNKVQLKWLDRFEAQLLHESVLRKEDLDLPPFKEEGGFKRLDKVFEQKLEDILNKINENLYAETA